MKRRQIGRALLVIGLAVGLRGAPARAAGGPLLVVVEAAPELEMDAGEVRRAIGAELHEPTRSPTKMAGEPADRLLIVAVDRERITMSLRESGGEPIARTIPAPAEPAARLRAITWLAGNLARDQVTAVVAQPPEPPAPPAPAPPLPPPAATVEPPRFDAPVVTVAVHPELATARPAAWTLGVAAGPAISLYQTVHGLRQSIFGSWSAESALDKTAQSATTIWRIEARHHAQGSRSFSGLALEGGAVQYTENLFGALAFAGYGLQLHRWRFEGNLGAGVDVGNQHRILQLSNDSYVSNDSLRAGLFAAGSIAAAHPVFETIELVLSLDAHVSVISQYDNYLASMLGVRYRL